MSCKGIWGAAAGAILCSVFLPLGRTADSGKSFTAQQRRWWAFQKIVKPTVPAVKDPRWIKNEIDSFILAKLEEKNLTVAPAADRVTLIRRATLDLTGLV